MKDLLDRGISHRFRRSFPAASGPDFAGLVGALSFFVDEEGKLAGERIYYDRGSVLRQVGLYHDPQSFAGRIEIVFAHPITVARAYGRKFFRRAAQ